MSILNNKSMKILNKFKLILLFFTAFLFLQEGYSQSNADPGISLSMSPPSMSLGSSGVLSATVGNYGNKTIVENSMRVTISVGSNAQIIGVAPGSDPRWTILNLTEGSSNTIKLTNTLGGFGGFDGGNILLNVSGIVVSDSEIILANIVYIGTQNSLLCIGCASSQLNAFQGNASNTNDNAQTSLTVTCDQGTSCDDMNPNTINDVYDANCGCAGVPADPCITTYLSDLTWINTPKNGWGPVEKDKSNGEREANDGNTLTINGVTYSKGLGVHANSEIVYALNGSYDTFKTDIGVDDEMNNHAQSSIQFVIYVDNVIKYQSPVMRNSDNHISVEVDVKGANELKLVVNDGKVYGIGGDHGDWANARLSIIDCPDACEIGSVCDDGNPNTIDDIYNSFCDCVGTPEPEPCVEGTFVIYPVPFDKEVFAKYSFGYDTDVKVEIFDQSGCLIRSYHNCNYIKCSEGITRIDLSNTGSNKVYYVKLTTAKEILSKTIIRN
ncbi:MAG: hypothetical protein ACI83B_001773 [Sediminicola sp.]|jgi:hypothetical protein